ncbi:MAG TPA: acetyl-CoA carboxylase biotin carboxyl carrier protein [Woeseiaceae bacterium]|nr:acetyl-CoA carboxylase biotin carboxyl carrier protein [Woeseiaceae bacterium]
MDIRKVKKLIELLEESGIAEIEITEGEESVRISRHGQAPVAPPAYAYAPPPAPAEAVPAEGPAAPAASVEPVPAAVPEPEEGFVVTAPMVGTFYAASSPGSPPFVQVGDRVEQGDVLCIVEAMKMMNQIEAEVSGAIKSIRVRNGEPVEYGQVLFVIDQRGSA